VKEYQAPGGYPSSVFIDMVRDVSIEDPSVDTVFYVIEGPVLNPYLVFGVAAGAWLEEY